MKAAPKSGRKALLVLLLSVAFVPASVAATSGRDYQLRRDDFANVPALNVSCGLTRARMPGGIGRAVNCMAYDVESRTVVSINRSWVVVRRGGREVVRVRR
jgi:hypothetical protein